MIKFGLLRAMFGDWVSATVGRSIRRIVVMASPRVASPIVSDGQVPPQECRRICFSPCAHELPLGMSVSPQSAPFFVIESIRTGRIELLPDGGVSADLIDRADLDWPLLSPGSVLVISVRNLDKDAPRDFRGAIWGAPL